MYLRDLPARQKFTVFGGVLLALLLGALDQTIVGPAMPQIASELGGMTLLAWVFTIYSLTSTIAVPIVGKLSDLYGRKWFYVGGITTFVAGSVLCGVAGAGPVGSALAAAGISPMVQLIIARAIQGVGGGMMMANGMAVVGDLFEPRERGKYQGFTGAIFALASLLGPALGGWLTDFASWRWIFFINVPLGALAVGVLWFAMPRPETGQRHEIDWWGALALVTGLVPLLLALNWGGSEFGWTSPVILGLGAVAAVALVWFITLERRCAEPILDTELFRDRSFSMSMAVLFLSGVGMFGSIMFLPLFLQMVQGASAAASGQLLIPMMLSMVAGSILCGQLISRTGRYRWLGATGLALATTGMVLLAGIGVETARLALVGKMVLIGLGMGVTMPLFAIALQAQFPRRIGEVTAAVMFFRSIGGTVGVALMGGVMNAAFARNLRELLERDAAKLTAMGDRLDALVAEPARLLNEGALDRLAASIPPGAQSAMATFVADLRLALSDAIAETFLIGAVLMGLAFLAMLAVREVPLEATVKDPASPEEIGGELIVASGVQPAEHEPVLVDVAGSAEPVAREGASGAHGHVDEDLDGPPAR